MPGKETKMGRYWESRWVAAVYRYYDCQGVLLYVGRSVDPDRRWIQHERDPRATWTDRAAKRVDDWFLTEADAIEAEAQAISQEGPLSNRRAGHTLTEWYPRAVAGTGPT